MNVRLRLHSLKSLQDVVFLIRPARNKNGASVHGRTMSFREIVINGHFVPAIEQFLRADRADVTGPAGDENVHRRKVRGSGNGTQSERAARAKRQSSSLKLQGKTK